MKQVFIIFFIIFSWGCGRPEITGPKDIIATNAKAVLFCDSLESFFDALPEELSIYSGIPYAFAEKSRPVAVVLTSLDPVELYIAIPVKAGTEEELKKQLQSQMSLESEYWSDYVFVPIKGSLPSSFGNSKLLPKNKESLLYFKCDIPELLAGNKDALEKYKSKPLSALRYILPKEQNRIISRFITHDLLDFAKELEEAEINFSKNSFEVALRLKAGSEQGKDYNSMSDYKLPQIDTKNSDIAFALSADFEKVEFPLRGLEVAFKSYLSLIDKPAAIFPMDTVFEKLRASGHVQGAGQFKVVENKLEGNAFFRAENQKTLGESVLRFTELMAPEYFSPTQDGSKTKILRPLSLPQTSVETNLDLSIEEHIIAISDKSGRQFIENSGNKGLLSVIAEAKYFTAFETNSKKAYLKVSSEENLIKIKVSLEEK